METRNLLGRFNFWSRSFDYRVPCGAQGILGNVLSGCENSTSCTSDQGGSQDGGGGSCNADGDGGNQFCYHLAKWLDKIQPLLFCPYSVIIK